MIKPTKYLVLAGTFFTSISSILIRLSTAPAIVISFYRMLFTVIFLAPILYKEKDSFKLIRKKDLLLCILSGVFLSFHFASWIASINMTTIANSTILVSCSPIFVAVYNRFILKESFSKNMIIGIIMSLIGTVIIASCTNIGSGNSMAGNILAFMGAVFVAGYLIIGGIVRKTLSAGVYVYIVYSVSAIVLFLMCLISNTPLYHYAAREFLIFSALAFFCSILGHTIYNYMMKYVSATLISVSTLAEPIFASSLALVIFKEVPSGKTLFGGTIILIGIFYYLTSQTNRVGGN